MKDKIPATVAILTHNSAKTLVRALESAQDFSEIIVCDGESTDDTLAIAKSFGAHIIRQDKQFLSGDGRIQNFAGVRNQALVAASYDWFFFLDSDEYIGPELAKEILEKTTKKPSVYWISRKYVHRGKVVDCSITYPSQQIRLFHRIVTHEFVKEVHEKIELRAGIIPDWLTQHMFVPVPGTAGELIAKWRGYLAIEHARRMPISVWRWMSVALRETGIALLYLTRLLRIALFCRGVRLPVSYELARVWYQWRLIKDSSMTVKDKERLLYRALLCSGFALVLFLSSFHLFDSPETWMDEGLIIQSAVGLLYTGKAALPVAPGIFEPAWYITTGFPLTLPLAGVFATFGVSLEAARLVMLAFLICFYAALFLYARKAIGGGASWLGFFFIVFFAPVYGHGRNVLGEIPGLLFMLLALLPLLPDVELTPKRAACIGVCAGFAFATKPIFILFLSAIFLSLFMRRRELALWRNVVFGLLGFLVPFSLWLFLQFDQISFSRVLFVYANPHTLDVGNAVFANVKRLLTEPQPLYFLAALALWSVSYVVRRVRRETIVLSEEALLFFSILVLFAYIRTAGYYRYFFPGQVFALLYLPHSLWYFVRGRDKFVLRAATVCLCALLLFQTYQTLSRSWVATHYNSMRTRELQHSISSLSPSQEVFAYQAPEVVTFVGTRLLYQYVEITPTIRAGETYADMVVFGRAALVITPVEFFQAHANDVFSRYGIANTVDSYVMLTPKII